MSFDSTCLGIDIWFGNNSKSYPKKDYLMGLGLKTTAGIEYVDFRFLSKHVREMFFWCQNYFKIIYLFLLGTDVSSSNPSRFS